MPDQVGNRKQSNETYVKLYIKNGSKKILNNRETFMVECENSLVNKKRQKTSFLF
jgi:hypothetical protein